MLDFESNQLSAFSCCGAGRGEREDKAREGEE
jgi:hypothetical protein